MNAREYLKAKGIHPTEPIYWDLENKRISLDELMDEFAEKKVKLCNKPAVIGSLPSDVEDYIVKTSAYLDDDFKMKGNKEIEDKLKRHSERLIAKYAS